MGSISEKVNIQNLVTACGVKHIQKANPFEHKNAIAAINDAVNFAGPSVVIFEAPCIALFKPSQKMTINDKCTSCKKCIREIGCPAMSLIDGKPVIEPTLCYGCTLCTQICSFDAIGGIK
jgi:indolepyruvate ferredoxin oxidoreductase, alpha subunit